ncbi:MAG: Asp-tRNA(Asn)/Glu-tRNA(Gln) amidotransferase subunit GatC [Clostridia bacterium]|nr:Asp-tRNA(Asn)/Glu-tRNA(Gln) amidotransferase subunit GatC [Clostridia bacterium]
MKITDKLVKYLAELSKIEISYDEVPNMKSELNSILQYMDILNQVDTNGVLPLSHIFDIKNVMREDKVAESSNREEILFNAPNRAEETFVVPKTVE